MSKTSKIFTWIAGVVLLMSVASCGKYPGFKKGEHGLYYKMHTKNNEAVKMQMGDLAFFTCNIRLSDSMVMENFPNYFPIDTNAHMYDGDLYDILSMLHEGDSATFIMKLDSFAKYYMPLPDKSDIIYFDVKIDSVYTAEMLEQKRQERMQKMEDLRLSEDSLRAQYLQDNKITVKPTATGLYYIPTAKGSGKKAVSGKTVTVNYTGKLLDGTVFDSSLTPGRDPISLQLGKGMVIPGWEEALLLMREGDKATVIIPSMLAYGAMGSGPIPPYATLIFDMELISVADASSTPAVDEE
ncbi:MAG: FKBP-type peptidyl-prolyl cis-trans isomerase [Bacteroidales bacterium]|jgi:FKBP-type peptidyl-prolyl cis-trans isomerase|nr:FKBP-type peptidyl-prolyl cis-trans isomerase [Bacteroidales bacterium]